MAFTCVPVVAQWGTVSYINTNQAACAANQWAVFTSADLTAYNASLTAGTASTPAGTQTTSFFPSMTIAEALPIFAAISLLWGLAFTLRAIGNFLKPKSGDSND
ncbi:MAG: hypothetical protein Q8K61_13030 [Gallionella sp.]|nr:hypothetical protein [Gallionella sp.]